MTTNSPDTVRIFGFTRYGGPEVQRYLTVPAPGLRPGTVRVRLRAAGINPGDVKVRNGANRRFPVEFPMAVGREAAGVVLEADAASGFEAGEPVFGSCAGGTGAVAEQVLLDAAQAARIPEGLAPEQAACIPVAVGTAWDALGELGVGPGDTVLVLGAGGGVGSHAVGLARHLGARVVGVASEAKHDLVTGLGAEHVASGPGWDVRAGRLLPGGGFAVLDSVGGDTLRGAAALVRSPGRIRSAADPALARRLGGRGITRRRTTGEYGRLAELIARGAVRCVLDAVHPFDDAAAAVANIETGHAAGRTVVTG